MNNGPLLFPYKEFKVDLDKVVRELKEHSYTGEADEAYFLGYFKGRKIITRGIKGGLAPLLQQVLWTLVEEMPVLFKHYLQVFDLSVVNGMQHIVHTQSEPEYKRVYEFKTRIIPTTAKVLIQDDGDILTMMLSTEY